MSPTEPAGTLEILREIVAQFGTPCYAYDQRCMQGRHQRLRSALPDSMSVFYSLKANASLGISEIFAACGLGADIAGMGELTTAMEAGFDAKDIFVSGPYKSAECTTWLADHPEAIISLDSPSEWQRLARLGLSNRAVLRLRPEFESRACVVAGRGSRFGFAQDELPRYRDLARSSSLQLLGFHLFAGSQILDAENAIFHLESALQQIIEAATLLAIPLQFANLGGGFGIPYADDDQELDLTRVGQALDRLQGDVPSTQLALELGRYLVADSGWYLTTVIDAQMHQDRPAVVVDGGTHQRTDFCGLNLRTRGRPPRVLGATSPQRVKTDVLGCLSLPADILSEACPLPPLRHGDVLAYSESGAYGPWSAAVHFQGYSFPTEVLFDGDSIELLRAPRSILEDQRSLRGKTAASS